MQTLQHQHKYMVGKSVLVNGSVYKVNADRCIDAKPADAEKLLLSSVWRKVPKTKVESVAPPKVEVASKPPPAQSSSEPPAPPLEPEAEAAPAAPPAEAEYVDPPVPEDGAEWPDPDERMSSEYLWLMADAYGVTARKNIKKTTLIERIRKEMFE